MAVSHADLKPIDRSYQQHRGSDTLAGSDSIEGSTALVGSGELEVTGRRKVKLKRGGPRSSACQAKELFGKCVFRIRKEKSLPSEELLDFLHREIMSLSRDEILSEYQKAAVLFECFVKWNEIYHAPTPPLEAQKAELFKSGIAQLNEWMIQEDFSESIVDCVYADLAEPKKKGRMKEPIFFS